MRPLDLKTVSTLVAGKLTGGDESATIAGVSTDSRQITPGDLFIALRGETFDGHAYLVQVAIAGAAAAIVDREIADALLPTIVVDDTRLALGRLATAIRSAFTHCKVVAVAGSNGKTSTKHLVHTALSSGLRGSMSPKSFNNDIGVPLTLFPVDDVQDDFVVLELGTNHPGEIRTLGQISTPNVVVITNCGEEHLEFLGDLDGVRKENASLVEFIRPGGTLVINGDDAKLLKAVKTFKGETIRFGFDASNNLAASDVQIDAEQTTFQLDGRRWSVPMLGRHNALNALAAIAVGRKFGLSDDWLAVALANSTKPEMRMERLDAPDGVTILNDAYNANPASMRAGLETLTEFAPPAGGRRVAVLGDMRELGDTSERYHREAGELVAKRRDAIDLLVCVGDHASKWIADAAKANGFTAPIAKFPDSTVAAGAVRKLINRGDLVLVKGSRGVKLERVVEGLVGSKS